MLRPTFKTTFRPLLLLCALTASVNALSAADAVPRNFRIPSLYHVGFWVRDIEKSRAFYKDYLGYEEPYELRRATGVLQLVVMKVNERQVIYLFPDATKILPNGDNLDHLGLETDNIAAVREHLLAHGWKVGEVGRGRIGDLLLGVKDPDGHLFEFTQFEPQGQLLQHQGKSLPAGRVSAHLRSATITVADLPASLRFYRDILGFKDVTEKRAGGSAASASILLQVPDGPDTLELKPYEKKDGDAAARAVPEYFLEVKDADATAKALTARATSSDFPAPVPVSVGADGRRQTSVVDPDGTRVVLQEATARP